jgi:DNA polymerase
LWEAGTDALNALMRQQTTTLGREGVLTVNLLGIGLPNGLFIRYNALRREQNPQTGMTEIVYTTKRGRSEVRTKIYGAKVIENVTQALARIIIGEQMLAVNRRMPVVLSTHDSVTSLVPEGLADASRKYAEECLRKRPAWADGLPLNCESKLGKCYG